jgi:hypothetical protein
MEKLERLEASIHMESLINAESTCAVWVARVAEQNAETDRRVGQPRILCEV